MEIIKIHPYNLKKSIIISNTIFDSIEELLEFFYNMVVPSYKLGADISKESVGLTSRLKELGESSGSWIEEFTDSLPETVGYLEYIVYIPTYSQGLPGFSHLLNFDKREEYLFYRV